MLGARERKHGRCRVRTYDLSRVKGTHYHCAKRPENGNEKMPGFLPFGKGNVWEFARAPSSSESEHRWNVGVWLFGTRKPACSEPCRARHHLHWKKTHFSACKPGSFQRPFPSRNSPTASMDRKRDQSSAVSSVVEHYLDTVGATGSNPVPRTILKA